MPDVVVGLVGEPRSVLDESDPGARFLAGLLLEPLVRRDDRDQLVPRLVEEVPGLDNGLARIVADAGAPSGRLVVTFRLREGLTWHDGAPLTSADVRFAWELARAAARSSRERADAELVDRVETPDARTAVLHLAEGLRTPRYPLLAGALPRHLLGSRDPEVLAEYARRPVGSGAYAIGSWDEGQDARLVPFPLHALGAPGLERIVVRFFATRAELIAALASGEVNLAPSGPLWADVIPQLEGFAEERGLAPRYTPVQSADLLLFNARRAPYADSRARAAVALAIDRRAIVQEVFAGRLRIPDSFLVAPSWAAAEVPALPEPDRQAAREALEALDICPVLDCPLMQRLPGLILVEAGVDARVRVAELIARDLRRVGVSADLVVLDRAALDRALAAGAFDMALVARGFGEPEEAAAQYVRGGAGNVTGWSDRRFDLLAHSAVAALTREERRPIYAELGRLWRQALPAVPLYQHLAVDVVPAQLRPVAPTAHGAPLSWNSNAWRMEGE